jgi:hypothetical protein
LAVAFHTKAIAQTQESDIVSLTSVVQYPPIAYPQRVLINSQSIAITLSGNDSNGAPLDVSIVTEPQNGSISSVDPTSHQVVYTPANPPAHDSFMFTVNDGYHDSAVAQVALLYVPPTPLNLTATASDASVALNWSSVNGASSYNVYQGTAAAAEGASPIALGLTNTHATITGLTNGTVYYFTVTALTSDGESPQSIEVSSVPSAGVASSGGGGGAFGILALLTLAGFAVGKGRHG